VCYLLIALLLAVPAFAEGPEFEVASIKPYKPPLGTSGGGPGTADPTHMTVRATFLTSLLLRAFDVRPYQVANASSIIDGIFDFALVLPEGATTDDVKIMWHNLLISRFGLKYHIEQREFPVDELVIGPKGHKLIENHDPPSAAVDPNARPQNLRAVTDKDGRLTLPKVGFSATVRNNAGTAIPRVVARGQPVSVLADRLSFEMGHPIIDKTGLTGKYDFALEYANTHMPPPRPAGAGAATSAGANAANAAAAPESVPELPEALQQQLGLRLVKGKGMLDVVVVEKLERTPTEN
jgi:uncharacterized protein (TIGR03435 family)